MIISLVESGEDFRNPTAPAISRWQKANTAAQKISHRGLCREWHCCQLREIPLFILLISLLETAFYFAADDTLKQILLYDTANRKQLWRLFTYMLLHTNGLHLGLNVVIQGLLGTPLEFEQGCLRCAIIYFGGGLAGSLGTSAFSRFTLMAGASGGVYALLTAHIPNVVLNYPTIKYAPYRIVTVTILIAADVTYIFFRVHFYSNQGPTICWVAHAAGAAAGILLGFLIFQGTSKWQRKLRTISCALLVLPFLFVIIFSFISSSRNLLL